MMYEMRVSYSVIHSFFCLFIHFLNGFVEIVHVDFWNFLYDIF